MASNNKIGGGAPSVLPLQPAEGGSELKKADQVGTRPIPLGDVSAQRKPDGDGSPTQVLIASGLAALYDTHYAPAEKNNALNMMVQALGASAGGPTAKDVDQVASKLRINSSRLLKSMVTVNAETLTEISKDSRRLVELAVVALGSEGLGKDKAGQLVADLEKVQAALGDLIAMPRPERTAFIQKLTTDVGWVKSVFDRGTSALDAAKIPGSARLDALTGIFQIVSKYANAAE